MNKLRIIGISGVSVFFLLFAYFAFISGSDPRIEDGELTVFEMYAPELFLFSYAIMGTVVGWFYAIKRAVTCGHKWWALGVILCWPISAIYLARRVH